MSEVKKNINAMDLCEENRKKDFQKAVLKILQSENYISEKLLQKVILKMEG